MNIEEMSIDEKRESLYDWIRNMDKELDQLFVEFLYAE